MKYSIFLKSLLFNRHERKEGGFLQTNRSLEVSIVMPCLNEAATVGTCVEKALKAMETLGLHGEVIVVDNGSTDASAENAQARGARVVFEPRRGVGYACRKGFEEARGHIMVMGDADGTYDFSELEKLILPLKNGTDFVIGTRLNGTMFPGSMSWVRLYCGNWIGSALLSLLVRKRISDSQSGFRAFRRSSFENISFESKGMELCTEMIVSACRKGLRILEVPISYFPRIGGRSKFNMFNDSILILGTILLSVFYRNSK